MEIGIYEQFALQNLTLVIDFLKKNLKITHIFFNLNVLYAEIFTLKAYNSAKKQLMTEIF